MDYENVVLNLKKTIEDLRSSKYSLWDEKETFSYMEILKKEYDSVLKSIEKLKYLITQFAGDESNNIDESENFEMPSENDICYLVKLKKYVWTEYLSDDFEYIKEIEMTESYKNIDVKKARKQLDILKKALMDIVATWCVCLEYVTDLIQYQFNFK